MRHISREIAGWFLLVLGLLVFYRCLGMLTDGNHYMIEAGSLSIIGVVIFRGGIHLLKVAVAAQVCAEAQQKMETTARPAPISINRRLVKR